MPRRRALRLGGAWLFLGLLAFVLVHHHVAQLDFNDNDDSGYLIENDEALDGDEILSRLILADDLLTPQAPRQQAVVRWFVPREIVVDVFSPDRPAALWRAPPERIPSA